MTHARKVDTTQADIVAALRKVGVRVAITSSVGNDFPDLVVSHRGRNILLECKTPGKSRTKGQEEFAKTWAGELHLVYSPVEAVNAVFGIPF